MDFSPSGDKEEAGLTVLMNNSHHYKLSVKNKDGKRVIGITNRLGSFTFPTGKTFELKPGSVRMKIIGSSVI
jgi:alpha-N-arabinofuranosidase